jgi:hypothetical protein
MQKIAWTLSILAGWTQIQGHGILKDMNKIIPIVKTFNNMLQFSDTDIL